MKILVNRFDDAKCNDKSCGAMIPVGAKIKWYGRGKVYGIGCHDKVTSLSSKSTSWVATTNSGAEIYQNRSGRCEDAPCCGCCGVTEYN